MEFTLSSEAQCSQNVIFSEQKGRLSQSNSSEKSGTFMCLLNSVFSTPCLEGKGHYRDKILLVKSPLQKTHSPTYIGEVPSLGRLKMQLHIVSFAWSFSVAVQFFPPAK